MDELKRDMKRLIDLSALLAVMRTKQVLNAQGKLNLESYAAFLEKVNALQHEYNELYEKWF